MFSEMESLYESDEKNQQEREELITKLTAAESELNRIRAQGVKENQEL